MTKEEIYEHNLNLFKDDLFTLPKEEVKVTDDFPKVVEEYLDKFNGKISQFKGELGEALQPKEAFIANICNELKEVLYEYYKDDCLKSYERFVSIMNLLDGDRSIYFNGRIINRSILKDDLSNLYRARTDADNILERHEMFHMPFERRNEVKSCRYSVAGLPCLYLANSTYLCYQELNEPDFNKLKISRFDISKADFKLLNLSFPLEGIFRIMEFNKPYLISGVETKWPNPIIGFITHYLIRWPLLLASSFRSFKYAENVSIKPEYIIPQFIMQWVVTHKQSDGVVYTSNKIKSSLSGENQTFENYAIPVQNFQEKGFCPELSKKVLLSKPVYWENINNEVSIEAFNLPVGKHDITSVEFEGSLIDYSKSDYGRLETYLQQGRIVMNTIDNPRYLQKLLEQG